MRETKKSVLFAGIGDALAWHVARTLKECGIELRHSAWEQAVFETVFEDAINVIVAGYPVPGADFGRFLSAVRSRESASRSAGLILVAAPGSVEQAVSFVGRGVNRVLMETTPDITVLETINELLRVRPRVPVRTAARILADIDRGPRFSLCQTENLSATGMLLRGWAHLPVGFSFDFELDLPGENEPLRGRATVSRVTGGGREDFEGIGAAFEYLNGSGQLRLEHFISDQIN